ncbi:adenylate/guanylate cyclase domain-containing protein [Tautonia plasticadhaerens]|uniref:adenylate/guanylate cyclase domain-containing protein n=1 Tax=Tautonia plasticadhaerens TaxID=2527974 RepID=UPI0011A60E85|nr:adenylate/guanylate cyclase domain-containing protein [Tautonia plasticadhaerens]
MGTPSVWIRISEPQGVVFDRRFEGPVLLGRQGDGTGAEPMFGVGRDDEEGIDRLVIAPLEERDVSRRHLLIEPIGGGRVRLSNRSDRVRVSTSDGRPPIGPGQADELELPVTLGVGRRAVRLLASPEDAPPVGPDAHRSLGLAALPPGCSSGAIGDQLRRLRGRERAGPGSGPGEVGPEAVAHWFQATIAVLQDAACAPDFYRKAAEAMVAFVGLSNGWVLTWDDERGEWVERVHHAAPDSTGESRPSASLLARVRESRTTSWIAPDCGVGAEASLARMRVSAAVAAPIQGRDGVVIGVLYGDRGPDPSGTGRFSQLEALLVELLAGGVAAGLARQESEAEASRRRVQFELFFSSDLARALELDPALLDPRIREATVMFGDIRGFSRLSESMGPECVCALVNDVMDAVTDRVREHSGVVVDYIGDGFIALWNAPAEQPDHAAMACRAALAIQRALPAIGARWADQLTRPLRVGIGINTGPVTVGNTGSTRRFKYGPLGHTVNLASRAEGATKSFGVPVLITGAVRDRIGAEFGLRKLARARVVGIDRPVELVELHEPDDPEWSLLRDRYEEALSHFEAARFAASCRILQAMMERDDGQFDVPGLNLLALAVQHLKSPPAEPFDPTIELTSK